jgi:hypothetical protein
MNCKQSQPTSKSLIAHTIEYAHSTVQIMQRRAATNRRRGQGFLLRSFGATEDKQGSEVRGQVSGGRWQVAGVARRAVM